MRFWSRAASLLSLAGFVSIVSDAASDDEDSEISCALRQTKKVLKISITANFFIYREIVLKIADFHNNGKMIEYTNEKIFVLVSTFSSDFLRKQQD